MCPHGVALNKFTFLNLLFTTYVGFFIIEFCWGRKYVFSNSGLWSSHSSIPGIQTSEYEHNWNDNWWENWSAVRKVCASAVVSITNTRDPWSKAEPPCRMVSDQQFELSQRQSLSVRDSTQPSHNRPVDISCYRKTRTHFVTPYSARGGDMCDLSRQAYVYLTCCQ